MSRDIQQMSREDIYKTIMTDTPVDGLFMEFGTAHGESMSILSSMLRPGQVIYGFDSFEGLPEYWMPGYNKGHFACKPPEQFLNREDVKLVVGLFQDTLGPFIEQHPQDVSMIHIDCDLYSSTKYVLTTLNSRIKPGTMIAFDEIFGYTGWEDHEYKAFMEFLQENDRGYKWIGQEGAHRAAVIITR